MARTGRRAGAVKHRARPPGADIQLAAGLPPKIRTMMSLAKRSLNPTAKATAAAAASLAPVAAGPTWIDTRLATIANCTVSAKSTATDGRPAPETISVALLSSLANGMEESRVRTLVALPNAAKRHTSARVWAEAARGASAETVATAIAEMAAAGMNPIATPMR